jgi:uncharacterized damage-inducible protein DinB
MLNQSFIYFIERDLLKLKEELNQYNNESDMWLVKGHISNSAGNLSLHLLGNLNHFIGATIGNTGYVRQRELEFSTKNTPRTEILAGIDNVIGVVKTALSGLTDADYAKEFPLKMQDRTLTTEQMLFHLLTHLSYHVGQINYHRRLCS